eukprot:9711985-Lingulodinium_polyedra.AAC.1
MTSKAPPPPLPAELGSAWHSPSLAQPLSLAPGSPGSSLSAAYGSAHAGPPQAIGAGTGPASWDPAVLNDQAHDSTGAAAPPWPA